jgi:hypothetical protein
MVGVVGAKTGELNEHKEKRTKRVDQEEITRLFHEVIEVPRSLLGKTLHNPVACEVIWSFDMRSIS